MAKYDLITLTGLRAFGHHGVFDFETQDGQEFVVDLEVALDIRPASASDDVVDTIHYGELAVAGLVGRGARRPSEHDRVVPL
mgnify:CR=1 FL=1